MRATPKPQPYTVFGLNEGNEGDNFSYHVSVMDLKEIPAAVAKAADAPESSLIILAVYQGHWANLWD